jgi:hypothetical protein
MFTALRRGAEVGARRVIGLRCVTATDEAPATCRSRHGDIDCGCEELAAIDCRIPLELIES